MKFFALVLSSLLLASCGGGDTQIVAATPAKTLAAIFPHPVRSASTVSGSAEIAIHTYQALYGQAPGYAQLTEYRNQIGTSVDPSLGFVWAASMVAVAPFNGMSDSDFSTLILNNMSMTPTSLTPSRFGTGREAYDALQLALADYLRAAGIASRGTVVVQMAELLSNMEGETTFGVYGAAATTFNKQASANLAYSTNAANAVASAVIPPAFQTPPSPL